MRTRTRLATTAGVTVLGFAAMGGIAQADTGGLGLSGLTDPLTKTLGGVVSQVVPTSKTSTHSPALNLPIHVHAKVPALLPRTDTARRDRGWTRTEATPNRGNLATANVDAALNASPRGVQARANVGLCASLSEDCGATQNPPAPPPPPPGPPGQPPQGPPSGNAPTATGSTAVGNNKSLPFTGGPIGSLVFLGALSVLTGAGAVGASRLRVRRES